MIPIFTPYFSLNAFKNSYIFNSSIYNVIESLIIALNIIQSIKNIRVFPIDILKEIGRMKKTGKT